MRLDDRWSANGVLNYVRGERADADDDLYRIAPLNALVAVRYDHRGVGMALESFLYARQDHVSGVNGETASAGYALFNLRGYWNASDRLRVGFGVNNLLDTGYRDHLAGINRVRGNPDLGVGERLPGYARSGFARLDYRW